MNNEPLSPEFLFNYHADRIVAYPNQLQGLLAVAYGNADVFVANATSANYLIDQLQLLTLQIRNFAPYHPAPYSFLARESNQKLIDYLNQFWNYYPPALLAIFNSAGLVASITTISMLNCC